MKSISNKSITFSIILLFIGVSFSSAVGGNVKNIPQQPASSNRGNTLYVGGGGPDNYTKIQDAVDNASDGYTVFVFDDSSPYFENVDIDKSISLIGEDKNTTFIEGSESLGVIEVDAEEVNISGFTVKYDIPNPPKNYNGIFVDLCWGNGYNCSIYENIITDTYFGILLESSYGNKIFNNFITDSHTGIGFSGYYGDSSHNYIYKNEIINCRDGIIFSVVYGGCCYNYIYYNLIWKNGNGVGFNSGLGYDGGVDNNYIFCNNILYNDGGLYLNAANRPPPKNNHIDGNNFIGNINYNVRFRDKPGLNYWDDKGFGNFWDDYTGEDNDGDGIGDKPYIIDNSQGVINKDNYPSMEPYGNFDPNAPDTTVIDGSTNPNIGVKYGYTFITTDPNDDDVFYYISWGDGTIDEWIGPFNSGEEINLTHTWIYKKNCVITAQAKDITGLVGCWGTLSIIISKNRFNCNLFYLRLIEIFPIMEEVIQRLIR